jgi:cysteine desulfurase/selenocysteine lyase
VIDRIAHFYTHENANVHRGVHLPERTATDAYEQARETVRRFIRATDRQEMSSSAAPPKP